MTVTVHPQFHGSSGVLQFPKKFFTTLLNYFHADFSIWLSRSSNFPSRIKALICKLLYCYNTLNHFLQNRNLETLLGGYERSTLQCLSEGGSILSVQNPKVQPVFWTISNPEEGRLIRLQLTDEVHRKMYLFQKQDHLAPHLELRQLPHVLIHLLEFRCVGGCGIGKSSL